MDISNNLICGYFNQYIAICCNNKLEDPDQLRTLLTNELGMTHNGYLHIYVSNGSSKGVNFNDFLITTARGKTRQINDYYPYGLAISGIHSDENEYLNKYTYKELQTGDFDPSLGTGLEMYDFHARFYDPQLGRWFTPDPAEQFSNPYLAMGNNPVMYVDPDGEFIVPMLLGAGISVLTNGISNSIKGEAFFEGAGKAALIGAIGGVASFGIGQAATHLTGVFTKAAFQTLTHGYLGGMMNAATGGSFESGFVSGAVASAVSTGTGLAMNNVGNHLIKGGGIVLGGSISGGLASMASGGSFWDGARNGAISSGLNHAMHSGYLGKGLMMASLTGKTRHLFGPDARAFSVEAGGQIGVGIKPIEKGVYQILRGSNIGWHAYDGLAFSAGTPSLAIEGTAIDMYFSGSTGSITPHTFTGTYHQFSIGADFGVGINIIAMHSRLADNTFVYGIGVGISLDAIPNFIDFTYQYGGTSLSKDSYHDNPLRQIFNW